MPTEIDVESVPTGLLTPNQRAFFRGEKDDVEEDNYRRGARHSVRQRMEQIEEDLQLLEEHGQEDLVLEFHARFSRVARVEDQLDEVQERLAALEAAAADEIDDPTEATDDAEDADSSNPSE